MCKKINMVLDPPKGFSYSQKILPWPEGCAPPPNSLVEILAPKVVVLGGESFRGD